MPRAVSVEPEYLITFSLRNACVTFYDDRSSRFRSAIFLQPQPPDGDEAYSVVHGFSEYINGYQRLTTVRTSPEGASLLNRCQRRPLGIGIPFSCNNIYHQAFHAVPAFGRWRSVTTEDADFVPLIYPSAAVGKKMSTDPARWHAWEFSVRPFTTRTSAEIASRTAQLVSAPCTCYDALHGNADAFNPIARRAAPLLRAFKSATMRNMPAPLMRQPAFEEVSTQAC